VMALHCSCAYAWQLASRHQLSAPVVAPLALTRAAPAMLAKKKGQQPKKRVKKKASPAATSFSPPPSAVSVPPPVAGSLTDAPPPAFGRVEADAPLQERLDEALKRAGIAKPGAEASRPPPNVGRLAAPNPNDPLSRIPKAGQELLERFFGGGALVFGSAFILSGLAVAVEAIAKVLGNPLPTPIDEALVQYVEPALTPSILILFGFSISLGLLKQLQLGSESTGVLYREEDE